MKPAVSRRLWVLVLALGVGMGPARGQSGGGAENPGKMLDEATRQVLRAFELMLRAIPQYAPPEVLENGDIIIRRVHPKPEKPAPPPPADPSDRTKT